jgi:hypothetical protein
MLYREEYINIWNKKTLFYNIFFNIYNYHLEKTFSKKRFNYLNYKNNNSIIINNEKLHSLYQEDLSYLVTNNLGIKILLDFSLIQPMINQRNEILRDTDNRTSFAFTIWIWKDFDDIKNRINKKLYTFTASFYIWEESIFISRMQRKMYFWNIENRAKKERKLPSFNKIFLDFINNIWYSLWKKELLALSTENHFSYFHSSYYWEYNQIYKKYWFIEKEWVYTKNINKNNIIKTNINIINIIINIFK